MKRFLIAPVLTIMIILSVLGGALLLKPEETKASAVETFTCSVPVIDGVLCVQREGNDIVARTLVGTVVARVPAVTVSAPTITLTIPRATIIRPPVTVRLPGVTLPGNSRTVPVELPPATRTVILPGQTVTPSWGQMLKPGTVIVTSPGPNGQTVQTSVTITPSPETGSPVVKEKEVRVSVPAAIGIGFGALILGLLLGLLAIYLAYVAGYKDSEEAEASAWRKFRNDVFGKKEKERIE